MISHMANLTEKQGRVLAFIREFIARKGFPPTRAEIAKGLRFRSPNAAGEHLRLLAEHFVGLFSRELKKDVRGVAPEAMELLRKRHALLTEELQVLEDLARSPALMKQSGLDPKQLASARAAIRVSQRSSFR